MEDCSRAVLKSFLGDSNIWDILELSFVDGLFFEYWSHFPGSLYVISLDYTLHILTIILWDSGSY